MFPLVLAVLAGAGALILKIFSPSLYTLLVTALFDFFWQYATSNTVQEAMGWTSSGAWSAFNFGLYLMIAGAAILIYLNIKDEHPYQIFVLVWSVIVLFSTQQHVRYEYYLAVNIALLAAVVISYVIDKSYIDFNLLVKKIVTDETPSPVKKKSSKKQVEYKNKSDYNIPKPNYLVIMIACCIIFVGCLFAFMSGMTNLAVAANSGSSMNPDWKSSLEWMNAHTPDPGLNYTQIYDPKTFTYPKFAYGVMSWWDYGHMITYIAKRIPNANPFQQGVIGAAGSSHFFVSENETEANEVLDKADTRYIITDFEMDSGKFYAMSTWHNASVNVTPYQQYMFTQTGIDTYSAILLNTNRYYNTMISRLHNFDGSYQNPSETFYVEYVDADVVNMNLPVIIKAQNMSLDQLSVAISDYNAHARFGYHAIAASPVLMIPTGPIPALQHYRLIHESSTNIYSGQNLPFDLKYVKTFEYVKGAKIHGSGIIEVAITTNTGRTFMYRQQSINDEFIVPYSTSGVNTYDVKATSKYHIIGTDKMYDVSEDAVMNGVKINDRSLF